MLYVCELICYSIYFTAEMNCWQEWLVFSDVFFFLVKSGCIDFVDFVDKLVSHLTDGDNQILQTNHVTWLLAQIIRVELVMGALNSDVRKVDLRLNICFLYAVCINSPALMLLIIFYLSTLNL